jgi:hypothetical protein
MSALLAKLKKLEAKVQLDNMQHKFMVVNSIDEEKTELEKLGNAPQDLHVCILRLYETK